MSMNMGFIPRTYQRAAGLQSEVTKWAVTRIAHRELEQRKLVTVARNDMTRSIREISRGQKRLRRSMLFYSKRMKQCRVEKEQRALDAQEKDRRSVLRRRHDVGVVLSPLLLQTLHDDLTDNDDDNGLQPDSHKNIAMYNVKESNTSPYTDLLIPEATSTIKNPEEDEDTCVGLENIDGDKNHWMVNQIQAQCENSDTSQRIPGLNSPTDTQVPSSDNRNTSALSINDNNTLEHSLEKEKSAFYEWLLEKQAKRRKKKKSYVSHVDIMKLQYSSNIHKLFDAVDTLAKVHGIKEHKVVNAVTITDPRENSIAMKRRQSLYSAKQIDMDKLPSVYLYTMMHGYEVTDDAPGVVDEGNLTLSTVNAMATMQNQEIVDSVKVTPISTDVGNRQNKLPKAPKDPTFFQGASSAFVVRKIPPIKVKLHEPATEDSVHDFAIIEAVEKANKSKNQQRNPNLTAKTGALNLPPIVAKPQRFKKTNYSSISGNTGSSGDDHISWETALGQIKGIHSLK